jgi:protein translocation Sec62 family protein
MSLLALRVSKADPHEGHDHAPGAHKTKRVKGLWTVKIEQQQECREDLHFVWLYEGAQIKQKLYAIGALAVVFAVVMFPLWPMKLRLGVWYLSIGMLGLIGLFFAMAIFRLILFGITYFTHSPGLWLYPNLFEDVGFFDSFRPVWGWQEVSFYFHHSDAKGFESTNSKIGEEEEKEVKVCFRLIHGWCYNECYDWPTSSCNSYYVWGSSADQCFVSTAKKSCAEG